MASERSAVITLSACDMPHICKRDLEHAGVVEGGGEGGGGDTGVDAGGAGVGVAEELLDEWEWETVTFRGRLTVAG